MEILPGGSVDLAYQRSGQGPPVLLIQGVGVVGNGWLPQVAALDREFETLRFDHRGIGNSVPCRGPIEIEAMAEDARRLLDHAGWASAHVVGHSMGGVIAQQLALDAPHRVRSLSLLCTFARGVDGARVTPRLLWIGMRSRIGTRRMRRRAFLELLMPRSRLRACDPEEVALRFAQLIGRDLAEQPPIVMKQLRALGRHDQSHRLSELRGIPTMVLSAREDPIARLPFGRALAAAIPGARFEELADASHGVPIEKPDLINTRLLAFLRGSEPFDGRSRLGDRDRHQCVTDREAGSSPPL